MTSEVKDRVLSELAAKGYQGRVVPIVRIQELEAEIERRHNQGDLDQEFYRVWLEGFEFDPPTDIPSAKSVIITVVPHPQFRVTFLTNGEPRSFVIPPTYLHYTDKLVFDTLREILDVPGYHLVRALVPVKLLLVRTGLGKYGRNNLTYIQGMGSFYRLRAFYSDMPCDEGSWQEPEMMKECETCEACVKACPTGAIGSDRILLHAERCIPFFNERHVAFPEWMDPSWHNSLIGCMVCQNVCPVDKPFREWIEDRARFSEKETRRILDGVPLEAHSPETQRKLEEIEWTEDLDILARNLRLLLSRAEPLCPQGD
jgi:epoxyqueuosine reductase